MKVLVVTYYWPPAGGPAVQRVRKLIPELHHLGWEVTVLTVENPEAPMFDESLLEGIPEGIKVIRSKSLNPYTFYKKLLGIKTGKSVSNDILLEYDKASFIERLSTWIRANVFIPDARVGWLPYLLRSGKRIIRQNRPDIIFSTSPPHSLQIGARKLASWAQLPWVADFRDPWTQSYWMQDLPYTPWAKKFNLKHEEKTIAAASAVTSISEGLFNVISPQIKVERYVIHNGFGAFANPPLQNDFFIIRYYGNLRPTQPPDNLFKACQALDTSIKKILKIEFIGKVFPGFNKIADKYPDLNIIFSPFLPFLEMMESSRSIGILFKPQTKFAYDDVSIGAKMYDYLAMRKPVLGMGRINSLAHRIIHNTNSGEFFDYSDIPGIKGFIERIYDRWKSQQCISQDTRADEYLTSQNAKKLSEVMLKLIQNNNNERQEI